MSTANDRYIDAAIRHAIGVRRLTAGEVKKIITLLDEADRDLVEKLQVAMARSTFSFTRNRIEKLLGDIRGLRSALLKRIRGEVIADLLKIVRAEVDFERRLIQGALPFEIELAGVSVDTLRTIVNHGVWNGRTTGGWFDSIQVDDQRRLEQQLRLGLVQQEPITDIVRRVRGTRANGFAGPLRVTRAQAETVVRTVVNGVSNAAREAVWEANPDVVQFVRWVSTLDGRTTLICAGRDGKLAPVSGVDSPLPPGEVPLVPPSARPPAHPNCLPGDTLVTPCDGIAAATKRLYEGEVVAVRTLAGHELTCTPNHPILTDKGWISAHLLKKGSRVIRYLGSEDPFSIVDPEDGDGPTTIEKIARPFLESGRVKRVTTTRSSFHGDGAENEICVVGTDRFLVSVENDAASSHHFIEDGFERRGRIHATLTTRCAMTEFLEGSLPSPRGVVSGRDLACALLGRASFPDFSIGGSSSSDPNTVFPQNSVEDGIAELAISAETTDSLSGKVSLDEVVHVGRRDFSGHVYNLQTGSGIYFAGTGSIITHNCRSVTVAYISPDVVGNRPFVMDTRRPDRRLADFRAEARRTGRPIDEVRRAWARENIGQVPAKLDFDTWLRRQPAAFQDRALGAQWRGSAFRRGARIDRFVDRRGNELSLEAWIRTQPEIAELAGLL